MLGILYESYVHPITILSTLPSAGVGAILALLLTHTDLSVIALIGIILLIGIVKKNAIMMIDFALAAEREEGKSPEAAIYEACLLRFRPIMMTTCAALLGGLPLALGTGTGSELRRPLGITIVGGLIVSPDADTLHHAGGLSGLRSHPPGLHPRPQGALGQRGAARRLIAHLDNSPLPNRRSFRGPARFPARRAFPPILIPIARLSRRSMSALRCLALTT